MRAPSPDGATERMLETFETVRFPPGRKHAPSGRRAGRGICFSRGRRRGIASSCGCAQLSGVWSRPRGFLEALEDSGGDTFGGDGVHTAQVERAAPQETRAAFDVLAEYEVLFADGACPGRLG